MREQGELVEWNDARGFGFIRPEKADERLFVHVSQVARIATRPRAGDRVTYELGRGRDGGAAAVKVSISGANPVKRRDLARGGQPAKRPGASHRLRLVLAGALAVILLSCLATGRINALVLLAYGIMGAISAISYHHDKRQAEAGLWRISEARLHTMDLLFGIIGGLLAQEIFRHKTAKQGFALISYAIALLHASVLLALVSGYLPWSELANLVPS